MAFRYEVATDGQSAIAEMHLDRHVMSATPSFVRNANRKQLAQLQRAALLGDHWGYICIPEELKTAKRHPALDLKKLLSKGNDMTPDEVATGTIEVTRVAVSMALFPSIHGIYVKHTTILGQVSSICRLVRDGGSALGKVGFWSQFVVEDVVKARGESMRSLCSVIAHYHLMGALPDAPSLRNKPVGTEPARDRSGEPEHLQSERLINSFQPYSDEFISAAGSAAAILIRTVGPTLLDAVEAALKVARKVRDADSDGAHAPDTPRRASEICDPTIASWNWADRGGGSVEEIGIRFRIGKGRSKEPASWPPRTFNHAMRMVAILQGAHAFPVALAIGPRAGELASMKVGLVRRTGGGGDVASFHSWKMERTGGVVREAPIPSLAVEAVSQQERLARILKEHFGVLTDNLWVSIKNPSVAPDMGNVFARFAKGLSLDHLITNGGANTHRFRKTLARIVALALVHAPKVLMDVFGHRDEEITIVRYILADPAILEEIQVLVREMVILKGVEAINSAETIQGAGAPRLRERVAEYATRLGRSALEPQNVLEFAKALSQDGTSWAIVAPGIVCTNFTEGGLCNKGYGRANPHYCHPNCENQLDFNDQGPGVKGAVMKAIETIKYSLDMACAAEGAGDNMALAQFIGQIRSLLNRWKEVDLYFEAEPRLRHLLRQP